MKNAALFLILLFLLPLQVQADVVPWGKPGDSKFTVSNSKAIPGYTFYIGWYRSDSREILQDEHAYELHGGGGNPMRAYVWAVNKQDTTLHTDSIPLVAQDEDRNWHIDKVEGGKIIYTDSAPENTSIATGIYITVPLGAIMLFLAWWLIRRGKPKKSAS